MLTCVTASLWLALRHRPGSSGLLFGLALACKQQALLCLPLILWAAWHHAPPTPRRHLRFLLSTALCVALLFIWDSARPGAGIHLLALANNQPEGFAHAESLLSRLHTWLAQAAALFWPAWPGALVLLGGALALVWPASAREPCRRVGLALFAWASAYSLLHLLPDSPLYSRYLLLLLPALLPLSARSLCLCAVLLTSRLPQLRLDPRPALLLLVLPALLLQPAPGPDPHAGIDELGEWLAARPVATVIYDRWLGWQLGFYLGAWHDKRLTWYPQPGPLVHDARRLCEFGHRYLPAPRDADVAPWLEALEAGGFTVTLAWSNAGYDAWQFTPPWREPAECPATS